MLGVYALYERYGAPACWQAMAFATTRSAYGAEYLAALLAFEGHLPGWSDAPPPAAPALARWPWWSGRARTRSTAS